MDAATGWTLGLAAISTLAACGAVAYAHATVRQAHAAHREAHQWRKEDTEDHRQEREYAAQVHTEQIAELRRIQEINAVAHEREIAQRREAAEAELRLARVRAVEGMADALVALVARAQEESINPPPLAGKNSPFRRTLLPTILNRFKAAAATYSALGCPDIAAVDRLADDHVMAGDSPDVLIGPAVNALEQVTRVVRVDAAFRGGDV